jgi:acetyltransferase-like isoleucine patch superfamily enzyme
MSYPLVTKIRNQLSLTARVLRRLYLVRVWGMEIGEGTEISSSAKLDKTNPRGIHIGAHTRITFGVAILSHDFLNWRHLDTRIGSYCFIGARSIILPGVTIGDHCVVAAGSVVTHDVPAHSMVAGNPAKVIKENIKTGRWGSLRIE